MPERTDTQSVPRSDFQVVVTGTPYGDSFYLKQQDGSSRSAECLVPIVLSLLTIKSVIDVGCGVGTWSEQFLERGVEDVLSIDGEYVNRHLLRIPKSCFLARDLNQPIHMDRRFDLAVCLEVAEHLKESRADGLVDGNSWARWNRSCQRAVPKLLGFALRGKGLCNAGRAQAENLE